MTAAYGWAEEAAVHGDHETEGPRNAGPHVTFVGPFPPPVHGQALATKALAARLNQSGFEVSCVDVSGASPRMKIARHMAALASVIRESGACYLSLNSNSGMWLTAALALVARLRKRPIVIHHHAYGHVRERKPAMVATAVLAGRRAVHLVLGKRMKMDLAQSTPEARRVLVLNNAGLVSSTDNSIRSLTASSVVLGHMSNLSREKGIGTVVEAAVAAHVSGHDVRLIVGGPCSDRYAAECIDRATQELGPRFEYVGALSDAAKAAFFANVDVFLFPTRYPTEAEPLVLLEALENGIYCVATDLGCIPDDLGGGGGVSCALTDFVDVVATVCEKFPQARAQLSHGASRRFAQLLRDHEDQLEVLMDLLRTAEAHSDCGPTSHMHWR